MGIFRSADILLPGGIDMEKWAVIACDQFTSDKKYWHCVRDHVGDAPSTLHMILPEAELTADVGGAVTEINAVMQRYLDAGLFEIYSDAYVYVERRLQNGTVRKGIVGVVDLESYDYHPGSESLIRATEQTILERIPPRQKIRKDAVIEFPHVLMLCDDEKRELVESVTAMKDSLPKLYSFDLMEDGGRIEGWLVQGSAAEKFDQRFAAYSKSFAQKYAGMDGAKVLLAVGDGNHSLATAKSCYEEMKKNHPAVDYSTHPARFALVELENIHDEAQIFEPIHRIITKVDTEKLLSDLSRICGDAGYEVTYILGDRREVLRLDPGKGELAVAVLQNFLDKWLKDNNGEIDYIHGEEELISLAQQDNAIGFLLPAIQKHQLFRGVISGGVLPRKTFSMGHAKEKRYYLEGRKIK